MTQTLTVEVPTDLYSHIKQRAAKAKRSVEDEVLELLSATAPPFDQADTEFRETIASLDLLDNTDLERAACSHLLTELATELETLHLKQQREPLTESEKERTGELIRAYERSMLIRAHAAALLKKRGVDVSYLVAQP